MKNFAILTVVTVLAGCGGMRMGGGYSTGSSGAGGTTGMAQSGSGSFAAPMGMDHRAFGRLQGAVAWQPREAGANSEMFAQ